MFQRVDGLVVFVCPMHGPQMPVDVNEDSVGWYIGHTKDGRPYKKAYPVTTMAGKSLWLLDWPGAVR
jgi:hypothetical protein